MVEISREDFRLIYHHSKKFCETSFIIINCMLVGINTAEQIRHLKKKHYDPEERTLLGRPIRQDFDLFLSSHTASISNDQYLISTHRSKRQNKPVTRVTLYRSIENMSSLLEQPPKSLTFRNVKIYCNNEIVNLIKQ